MPVERRTPAGSGLVAEEWRDSWSSLPQVYASAYSATPSYGLRGRPSRLMHAVHQRLSGKPVAGNPHGRIEEGGGGWVYSRSSPTLPDQSLLFDRIGGQISCIRFQLRTNLFSSLPSSDRA